MAQEGHSPVLVFDSPVMVLHSLVLVLTPMKSNQNQTYEYIQHGTRSWLYILSSAHLPQITTYF